MIPIKADPFLSGIEITDLDGVPVTDLAFPGNYLLKVNFGNNGDNPIPPMSARILIGFGSGLIKDPSFDPQSSGHGEFLTYYYREASGQAQLAAVISKDLPANFSGEMVIPVQTTGAQSSWASGNFLIYNQNKEFILVDEMFSNNGTGTPYTIK